MTQFYKYFKENMDDLGLPAPESLFGTLQTALANAAVILSQIDKFGKTITIAELVGAGTGLELLSAAGACTAAFYVGAVIGSMAVATGRSLAGGTSLADVLATLVRFNLNRPWVVPMLQVCPAIYDSRISNRYLYRYQFQAVAA